MEIDPKYVDVIVLRWQTLTGKKATLDGDGRMFKTPDLEETDLSRVVGRRAPFSVP